MPEETTTLNVAMFFQVMERFITILYMPIITWMLVTVLAHERELNVIGASRFSATDGFELTLSFNQATQALQASVAALQTQQLMLEEHLDELEDRMDRYAP